MCACRCGIKLTVDDGRVRYTKGTRGHPANDGVLRAMGAAGLYSIGFSFWEFSELVRPLRHRPHVALLHPVHRDGRSAWRPDGVPRNQTDGLRRGGLEPMENGLAGAH